MDKNKAIHKGYMTKQSAGPATALALAKGEKMKALKTVFDMTKGTIDTGIKGSKLLIDTISKAAPYAIAAPPALGLLAGYGVSQATSPSGEDVEEAQKHLEEQALLEYQADLERQRKARELMRQKLLGPASRKKEREIRI